MSRKAQTKTSATTTAPALNPHAAGVDIGATTIYVAVPADRDPEPVRRFGTFTQDLLALAQAARYSHGGHGGNRRLLDTPVPDPGGTGR